ncbi:MAG: redoxin family protein [Streptococcus sp.]|nr:redoxin family protein [Streptococcus sp.]
MKKTSLLVTMLLCAGLLGACSNQQASSEGSNKTKQTATVSKSSKEKDQKSDKRLAKDFSLQDVNGKNYKLSDFKGKKVYVKFWASWCSICLSTLADTDDLAKEEAGKDYVVLTVVSPTFNGEKSEDDFKKWYKSLDYKNFPVLIDNEGSLLKEYNVHSYPSAIFIDTDGNVAKTHVGFIDKKDVLSTLDEI